MKLPDKFYFFNGNIESVIYFAARDGYKYVISGGDLDLESSDTRTTTDAASFLKHGYWTLTVPDKFCVRGTHTGRVYSMIKDANGLYVLKNQVTGNVFYSREEALEYLYGISRPWEILENTTENSVVKPLQTDPCEKPEKKLISINVNDVRAAAEFDVSNNPHTKANGNTVEEIEEEILGYLKEMYDALMNGDTEWKLCYTGTRTYRILFQPEDASYGRILILSETSVVMPTFFAYVDDFLSQN